MKSRKPLLPALTFPQAWAAGLVPAGTFGTLLPGMRVSSVANRHTTGTFRGHRNGIVFVSWDRIHEPKKSEKELASR